MVLADDRSSVLDAILAFNADRKPKRVRLKLDRMDESPFAFFRGTAHLFADAWPALGPTDPGPAVLLCGDLHLENFGAYRGERGDDLFDLNDFDEALVAPVGLDLVRCMASILLAAEQWRLSPLQATGIALAFLDHYRQALQREGASDPLLGEGVIRDLLGPTTLGTQAALLNHVTEPTGTGTRRLVRVKSKRPEVGPGRVEQIRRAVEQYGQGKSSPDAYKVHDVTARLAGIGSLGVRRYLVLIEGEGSPDRNRLLDIKEELPSALLGVCPEVPQPDFGGDEALRVVEAQRTLQAEPVAGLDVIAIEGDSFRVREMIPEENRASLDRLQKQPAKLRQAVEVAGRLTGRSHLRGGDAHHESLRGWAAGPARDALLAAAVRFAERTRTEYDEFHRALRLPGALARRRAAMGRSA